MELKPESSRKTRERRIGRRPLQSTSALGTQSEIERIGLERRSALTIFLVGRECPLTCSMCDLWKFTLPSTVPTTPVGHLPYQIQEALEGVRPHDWIKLYNASNFFDPMAVPLEDLEAIALHCQNFERVIVENHPRFDNAQVEGFAALLEGKLEIAVGLEATEDQVLRLLNKQMTVDFAERTIRRWRGLGIDVRVFLLIKPPHPEVNWEWVPATERAIEQVFDWGVRHVSLIPTRVEWGLLNEWYQANMYIPPTSFDVELLAQRASTLEREGQSISIDLWDWEKLDGHCPECASIRGSRLQTWNEEAVLLPQGPVTCSCSC